MRSCPQCSSPFAPLPTISPSSIFAPEFLALLLERDEPPTALEAELAGPWRAEPLPGRPGWYGVLRGWDDLAAGDAPHAVFDQEVDAQLYTLALPLIGRRPSSRLGSEAGAQGFPLMTVDEQGPREHGALVRYEPEVAAALHLLQGLVRRPALLAGVIEAAGPGALAQVGRILARRWWKRR